MPLCKCGCGRTPRGVNSKFVAGHNSRIESRHLRSQRAKHRSSNRWNKTTKEERFWASVVKNPTGCWVRTGHRPGVYDGSRHRIAWELTYGPIPNGLQVLHKCDNRPCTRPDHLFLGTQQDNIDDMIAKGGIAKGDKLNHLPQTGEKNHAAKLTEELVRRAKLMLKQGVRQCDVMRATGISRSNISCIAKGVSWNHVVV